MNEKDNFVLVPRPPGSLEKVEPGAKRIVSGMVADTLALAKKEPSHKSRPLRIVLVDNEDWLLEMLEAAIRIKFKNVTVQPFQDGSLAWQELLRADPNCLIADLRHPTLSGFDMVSRLAVKKVTYPILIYSFLMDKPSEHHLLRLAGPHLNVTCLCCPFTVEQFYEALFRFSGPGCNLQQRL